MLRKLMITFITTRNGHNGSRSVSGQYIFRNPNRDFMIVERIYGIGARKAASYFFFGHSFSFTATLYISDVFIYCLFLLGSGDLFNQFMFGSDNHKVYAE